MRYSSYRAVITPSKFLHAAYAYTSPDLPAFNLTFGVDIDSLVPAEARRGLPVRFGFVGQLASHKGTDLLIDAFRTLPAGSAELHVFGPEDQSPVYMKMLREKAAGLNVFFRGTFPKETLAAVLSEFDFLVIPSTWYENSPLVLLYSLACHTPVIVSDVEGMTEFVEHDRNGYVFDRGNIDSLARVMKKIVDNPDKSRALSATTEYKKTTKLMAEEVVRIYGMALHKSESLSLVF
jgi:glycosyltransferase involved in cell wall biosynthesis